MQYLIGIDLGTSGTKTVLFDTKGNVIAHKTVEYPMYQPQNGWAEQDPQDWWNAAAETIRSVIAQSGVNPADIRGLGISGQMHGLVMLDKEGKVLRRSIIWCDQRTAKECEELTEKVGKERLIEITANPAMTGFTASKILWVRNHEPEIYAKCAHILLPKDYVRYELTGEFATEVSDASGMQLLDIKNRCWSDEVLEKLDIDKALLAK
ncbi:MAG: FGGY family carbohydrate kinase, partial [Acutalibacteraceae bacterium]